jgi:predicted nuclease of predicted toxin-antitoxin system
MKIKLDENLPESLLEPLAAAGHDVDNVKKEGIAGHPDPAVWQAAQLQGRLLITQDLDFSDIRKFAPGTHFGLVLIRLNAPGRLALASRVMSIAAELGGWERCFVVLTDQKVRILRPK